MLVPARLQIDFADKLVLQHHPIFGMIKMNVMVQVSLCSQVAMKGLLDCGIVLHIKNQEHYFPTKNDAC